jgi:hypothetical protein
MTAYPCHVHNMTAYPCHVHNMTAYPCHVHNLTAYPCHVHLAHVATFVHCAGAALTPAHVPPADASASASPACPSGCYIGQETISKLHNNNGVKQQLWGVQLSQLSAPGAVVTAEGEKVGKLTSVTDTPDGEFYALAYIKSKSRGAQVSLEGGALPGVCHSLWTVPLMLMLLGPAACVLPS